MIFHFFKCLLKGHGGSFSFTIFLQRIGESRDGSSLNSTLNIKQNQGKFFFLSMKKRIWEGFEPEAPTDEMTTI